MNNSSRRFVAMVGIGLALMVPINKAFADSGFTGLNSAKNQAAGYTYTKIAALGETAPGGAQYFFDLVSSILPNGIRLGTIWSRGRQACSGRLRW